MSQTAGQLPIAIITAQFTQYLMSSASSLSLFLFLDITADCHSFPTETGTGGATPEPEAESSPEPSPEPGSTPQAETTAIAEPASAGREEISRKQLCSEDVVHL